MHKVAHQIIAIYDWVSGPAMTEQERMTYRLAEADHRGGSRLVV